MKKEVQIESDGVTVWVNGDGGLLGRFGRMGIDVHVDPAQRCHRWWWV
jgi:hypothetical protein